LRYILSFRERAPYGIKDERTRQWIAAQMKTGGQIVTGAPSSSLLGVYQTERMMRHLRPRLGTVTVPTLVMHAREDDTTSLRSADWVETHVGSSLVRKVILENSYHNITMDNERDEVVRETLGFLLRNPV
jgi:carboxylesterase